MSYMPVRGGTRGGKDLFQWDDVKTDKHRENYLGMYIAMHLLTRHPKYIPNISRSLGNGAGWSLAERKRPFLVSVTFKPLRLKLQSIIPTTCCFRYSKKSKVLGQKEVLRAVCT